MGHPSVYPTSATLYDPQRAWSGYTLSRPPNTARYWWI